VVETGMDARTRVTYQVAQASAADAGEETPVQDEEPQVPEAEETELGESGATATGRNEKTNPSEAATNDGTITIYNRDTHLELKVLKVDATDQDKYLTGAEFQLQKKNSSGYVAYTVGAFADSPYTDASEAKLTINDKDQGISFQIATDGDYKLVETRTPDGYVKLTAVEVDFTVVYGVITPAITVDDAIVVGYEPATSEDGPVVTIANTPGVSLPHTGGPGTTLVYVLGSLLTLLALALLIRRRAEQFQRD